MSSYGRWRQSRSSEVGFPWRAICSFNRLTFYPFTVALLTKLLIRNVTNVRHYDAMHSVFLIWCGFSRHWSTDNILKHRAFFSNSWAIFRISQTLLPFVGHVIFTTSSLCDGKTAQDNLEQSEKEREKRLLRGGKRNVSTTVLFDDLLSQHVGWSDVTRTSTRLQLTDVDAVCTYAQHSRRFKQNSTSLWPV